jgi:hypothetical protein
VRRPRRASARIVPRLEWLEDRLTPTNVSASVTGTTLTIAKTAGDDSLTITRGATFETVTVATTAGNTINNTGAAFAAGPINSVVVKFGTGSDSLTFDGTANGFINLTGNLSISGTGGDKIVSVHGLNVQGGGKLMVSLTGSGKEIATFTDVNVSGAATLSHPGTGDANVNITTALSTSNNWGGLAITSGVGKDITAINDTNFAGSVTINDGVGGSGTSSNGSVTRLQAKNDANLTTIAGNLSVSAASGGSATVVSDYNVTGNVSINTGPGLSGSPAQEGFVLEESRAFPASATPVIGGNVTITGTATPMNSLLVAMALAGAPLIVDGNVTVNAGGAGQVAVLMQDLSVPHGSTAITLGAHTTAQVTIAASTGPAAFGALNITSSGNNAGTFLIGSTAQSSIPTDFAGSVKVSLGGGNDLIQVGFVGGPVDIMGNLSISGTGGNKTITAADLRLIGTGNLNLALAGSGTEASNFTDVNVAGAATITHPGAGNTTFTIANTGLSNTENQWGSLSITNGQGADTNQIDDTNFAGSVKINNGPGQSGNTSQGGGGITRFATVHDPHLTTIAGGVTITTASGQSDNELDDCNVLGNVTITAGPGIVGQVTQQIVAVAETQTFAAAGNPVIGGNVTVTSGTQPGSGGLFALLGEAHTLLTIAGNLTINASGTGSAGIILNDVSVPTGTTAITLGAQTNGIRVDIFGSTFASTFGTFNLTAAAAAGSNVLSIQDQPGETDFTGKVTVTLGTGTDTLNLASDASHPFGVFGAVVKLLGASSFNGGAGASNTLFEGELGVNLLLSTLPAFSHF